MQRAALIIQIILFLDYKNRTSGDIYNIVLVVCLTFLTWCFIYIKSKLSKRQNLVVLYIDDVRFFRVGTNSLRSHDLVRLGSL